MQGAGNLRRGLVIGVLIVVVGIVVALVFFRGQTHPDVKLNQPVPASFMSELKQASQIALQQNLTPGSSPLVAVQSERLNASGKPEVLYIGADFCPFCATLRWPLTLALLHFGSFKGLKYMRSSSTDVYPDTPTVSYYQANFSGSDLYFAAVETETRDSKPLEQPTTPQQQLFNKWDAAPFTSSPGAIPFLYIDGRYLQIGSPFSPGLLTGKNWSEVIQDLLKNPGSKLSSSIYAMANLYTAAFCGLTGGQPATVCQSPGVQAASASLPR